MEEPELTLADLERRARGLLLRHADAFATVALAALPAAYTLYPRLATGPGFWNEARDVLFAVWLGGLFLALVRIRKARDADAVRQERLLALLSERIAETAQAQVGLQELVGDLKSGLQATRLGMSTLDSSIREQAVLERLSQAIASASRPISGFDPLPPLPEDAVLIVTALHAQAVRLLYPADLAEAELQPTVRALVNVLDLSSEKALSQAACVRFEDRDRQRLPQRLRRTRGAIVVPLRDPHDAKRIGAIIACSSEERFIELPTMADYQERTREIADHVEPIISLWCRTNAERVEQVS